MFSRNEVTDVLVRVHASQSFEPRRATANQLSITFTSKPERDRTSADSTLS